MLVILKHQRKKLNGPIKLKLIHKRLYSTKSGKYLGIKIDSNLNWKQYIQDIAVKLSSANVLSPTIRSNVNRQIVYANLIWGQSLNSVSRIVFQQKES